MEGGDFIDFINLRQRSRAMVTQSRLHSITTELTFVREFVCQLHRLQLKLHFDIYEFYLRSTNILARQFSIAVQRDRDTSPTSSFGGLIPVGRSSPSHQHG